MAGSALQAAPRVAVSSALQVIHASPLTMKATPSHIVVIAPSLNLCVVWLPTGTYADSTLLTCTPCASGKYSSSVGSTSCTGTVSVKKAGYYWTTGSSSNAGVICPPGYYCNGTGVATPCPAGRYNASTGAANLTSCRNCTAVGNGFVCPLAGTSPNGASCPPGTYANVSLQTCIP